MTSNRQAFRVVHTDVALIDKPPLDILGAQMCSGGIEGGTPLEEIASSWRRDEREFESLRQPFLLY